MTAIYTFLKMAHTRVSQFFKQKEIAKVKRKQIQLMFFV